MCICGYVASSLSTLKRHRCNCNSWKSRDILGLREQKRIEIHELKHGCDINHKKCSLCNQEKHITEFNKGMCKRCRSLYNSNYRATNAEKLSIKRSSCREAKRAYVSLIKSNPCIDCGHVYQKEAMTFDHRTDKIYDIYRLVNHPTASLEKLKNELEKCDLVCVGCHRNRSHDRLSEYVTSCKEHRPVYKPGCKKCIHYAGLARFRARRLDLVRQYKSKPCIDCGNMFNPWQMDLDHIDEKLDNVSNLIGSQASLSRIMVELNKCEVVCCWCHVSRTVERRKAA